MYNEEMDSATLLFLLIGGWIILKIYWYHTDPRSYREILQWFLLPKNLFFTLLDLVTGILLILMTLYYPSPKTPYDALITSFGLIIYVIGWIMAVWARHTMRANWAPAAMGHDIERQHDLIMNGPFKFSRNPIYIGLIMVTLGLLITMRSFLLPLALIQIYFFYKSIKSEEKLLEKYFGKEYSEYKSKTPRFLFF